MLGSVLTTCFDGDKDDVLPMHKHDINDVHFTIVARGSVKIHGPAIGENVFKAGALIDFFQGIEHEFICLEDGTRFYNIVKNVS